MSPAPSSTRDTRWTGLQTDLRDLAFVLDRQGSHEAADLACTVAARIDELLALEIQSETGAFAADPIANSRL